MSNDLTLSRTSIIGIAVIIMIISTNFTSETLSCRIQKFFNRNMYGKHLIVILTVYFSISILNVDDTYPPKRFLSAIFIWVLFLLFNRMSVNFMLVSIVMTVGLLVCDNYIKYYTDLDAAKYKKNIEVISTISNVLLYSNIVVILTGFILYFQQQYQVRKYSGTFSITTFLLGKECV